MLLGSLLLLVATMSTAQESGEQLDRPQRSQPPRPHMKVLSGSSMEQPKNKLKSSTPMLQKVRLGLGTMDSFRVVAISGCSFYSRGLTGHRGLGSKMWKLECEAQRDGNEFGTT